MYRSNRRHKAGGNRRKAKASLLKEGGKARAGRREGGSGGKVRVNKGEGVPHCGLSQGGWGRAGRSLGAGGRHRVPNLSLQK